MFVSPTKMYSFYGGEKVSTGSSKGNPFPCKIFLHCAEVLREQMGKRGTEKLFYLPCFFRDVAVST